MPRAGRRRPRPTALTPTAAAAAAPDGRGRPTAGATPRSRPPSPARSSTTPRSRWSSRASTGVDEKVAQAGQGDRRLHLRDRPDELHRSRSARRPGRSACRSSGSTLPGGGRPARRAPEEPPRLAGRDPGVLRPRGADRQQAAGGEAPAEAPGRLDRQARRHPGRRARAEPGPRRDRADAGADPLPGNVSSLSTVTITATEIRNYSPRSSPTFATQIARTFHDSLEELIGLGKAVVLFAVALAPWLPLLLVLAFLILWALRRLNRLYRREPVVLNRVDA